MKKRMQRGVSKGWARNKCSNESMASTSSSLVCEQKGWVYN